MDNSGFEEDLESTTGEGKSTPSQDALPEISAKEAKQEKRRIYKNLFVISSAFLLLFTAFGTTSSLQSSINEVEGLCKTSYRVLPYWPSPFSVSTTKMTRGFLRGYIS